MLMLLAFSFSTHFHRTSIALALDPVQKVFGVDDQGSQIVTNTKWGLLISAFLIPYTICMTPGGIFSDRVGSRRALMFVAFGTALFCAMTGLWGMAAGKSAGLLLGGLWVIRGLMGCCSAPLYPAAGRMVLRWVTFSYRGTVNMIVAAAMGIGMAVNYPLFGWLVDKLGWEWSFICTGLATAALGGLWAWLASDHPPGAAAETDAAVERRAGELVWKNRSLWLLTISYASVGYVEYMIGYWSKNYFTEVMGLHESIARWYASVPNWGLAVGMLAGGVLADRMVSALGYRWGRASVGFCGLAIGALCMMLSPIGGTAEWACTMLTLSMTAMGVCEAAAWTTAVDLGGRANATSAGIVNTGGNIGGFISPALSPFVAQMYVHWTTGQSADVEDLATRTAGWGAALQLAGVIALVGAALWFWIDASERSMETSD